MYRPLSYCLAFKKKIELNQQENLNLKKFDKLWRTTSLREFLSEIGKLPSPGQVNTASVWPLKLKASPLNLQEPVAMEVLPMEVYPMGIRYL